MKNKEVLAMAAIISLLFLLSLVFFSKNIGNIMNQGNDSSENNSSWNESMRDCEKLNVNIGKLASSSCESDSDCMIVSALCRVTINKNFEDEFYAKIREYDLLKCNFLNSERTCENYNSVRCAEGKCIGELKEGIPVCGDGICESDKNESVMPGMDFPGLQDNSYYNGYYICGRDCGYGV